MATLNASTLKTALLTGKAGLLQALQRLTLDPTYVPARLPEGMVVGIWGEAVVRLPDGTVRELKVGEMVRKGYVIMTSQNGIVQLEVEGDRLARVPADREMSEAPGAGLIGGEDGSLDSAERVGRIIEVVSPAGFDFSTVASDAYTPFSPAAGALAARPALSVDPVSVGEGDGHAVFTVRLDRVSDAATTLNLTLNDGTATGKGTDYGATGPENLQVSLDGGQTWTDATSVTLPPGATTVLVRTPITDDVIREPNETFTLTASVVSGDVRVTQPTGVATIVDNGDTLPYFLPIAPVKVNEGAPAAVFTVTLSEPSTLQVTVRYTTADGTATGGADYTPVSGELTFAPGQTTATVSVPILPDAVYEGAEKFTLKLSEPVNAGLIDPIGEGTIADDGSGTGGTDDDRPRVATVSSPTAQEGQPLDFTVTLTNTSTTPTVLEVTPRSGTGTVGVDTGPLEVSFDGGKTFTPVTDGKVTVPPGTDTLIVRVPTVPDQTPEDKETIFLDVKPQDLVVAPIYGTGSIEDAPLVSISGPAEVDEAIGDAAYTVSLNHASTVPVTVRVKTSDGVATAGSDYTEVDRVLTFAPGEISKTVLVPISNDDLLEGKEAFTIGLSDPTSAVVDRTRASVTTDIADDGLLGGGENKDAPTLAVTNVSVAETAGFALFDVTLSKSSGLATTVALALADGTAKGAGVDYGTTGAGNLQVSLDGGTTWADASSATFAPGKTSVLVRTPVVADSLDDTAETFTLRATTTAPTGGTANPSATGTATIIDLPTLRIDDPLPANEAAGVITFTVTLSSAAATPVTVNYATADGTATQGTDYAAQTGTLTFAPGETTKTISVPISDDTVYEGPETFTVNLGNVSPNAVIADPQGVGTIKDDGTGTVPPGLTPTDDRPHATINNVTVNEGAGTATFTVTLTGTAKMPLTLDFDTADGTAKAGSDYTTVAGTLTFAPGETTKTITVPIINDTPPVYEGAETFNVNLRSPAGTIVVDKPVGLGTIMDDGSPGDTPMPPGKTPDNDKPLITISDAPTVNEASSSAIFTVTLSNASALPVTVKYSSVNGTAEAGFDYEAVLGTLTFAPGETSQTIAVKIINEDPTKAPPVYEGPETFQIVLTDPTNASVNTAGPGVDPTKDGTGIGTIFDDGTGILVDPTPNDPPPAPDDDRPHIASISDAIAPEGSPLTFTVTLSNVSNFATAVTLTAIGESGIGKATIGTDTGAMSVSFDGGTTYSVITGSTVSVPAGAITFLVRIATIDDSVYEGNETLSLQAATSVDTMPVTGIGTITDAADHPQVISITNARAAEGSPLDFTVTLSNPSTSTTSVTLTLRDGSANIATDTPQQLLVSFDGGSTYTTTAGIVSGTGISVSVPAGITSFLVRVPTSDDAAAPVYEGPETLTLQASTAANGAAITGTGTIYDDGTNGSVNDLVFKGVVSEEGLSGGLADTTGTTPGADTTNAATVSSTIALSSGLTNSGAVLAWDTAQAATLKSSATGTVLTWNVSADGHTLTGSADGSSILTAELNNTGTYIVTLLGAVRHAVSGEDALSVSLGFTATQGGYTGRGVATVTIEDDAPTAITDQSASVTLQDTNLLITLDISGSMLSFVSGNSGATRLDTAVAAIKSLINSYAGFGDVRIEFVTFSDTATVQSPSKWLTKSEMLAMLALIEKRDSSGDLVPGAIAAGGDTNYDAALLASQTAFVATGSLSAAQNVAYFFSDGYPTLPKDSIGVSASEEEAWISFLSRNQMTSYAIGMTSDVTQGALNPIAWNTTTGKEANSVVVTDLTALNQVVQGTVPLPQGNLVAGGKLGQGGMVGADEGFIKSVTIDGVSYTLPTVRSQEVIASDGSDPTFDPLTKRLTVSTAQGGKFIVDMDDGTYEYRVPASVANKVATEEMRYVVSDKDGDTVSAAITVHVNDPSIVGTIGADTLTSDTLISDYMIGLAGNDSLSGLGGNDTLVGGSGSDWLTGGTGNDVFAWSLGDQGPRGTPAVDTITDFNPSLPADGGDIIDLRDLLSGETTGTLENYLEFSFAGSGSSATTTIHVSSTGAFTGGSYSAAAEDQTIVLSGVDLRASLGLGSGATDTQIISTLLTQGKLIVDN